MGYVKQIIIYTAITIAVVVVGVAWYQTSQQPSQPTNARVYPKLKSIEPFTLQQGNQAFTEQNFKGKWSFVFFGYTYCPDICPTTMASMRELYQQLPSDVQKDTQVVLVSVDPERDTPELVEKYSTSFEPSFIGTTAEHPELKNFAKNFGVVYFKTGDDPKYYDVEHTAKIFLIDPLGRRYAYFDKVLTKQNTFVFDVPQMVEDYRIIRR